MNARGTFGGCLIAALLAASSGCGEPPEKKFDGETLAAGETFTDHFDPTATRSISVHVPTGVLALQVVKPTDYVDDGSKYTFSDVAAADGAELVGIQWELDAVSVYPTDVREALMATSVTDLNEQAFGSGMGEARLTVVADGHRTRLPVEDDPTQTGGHAVVGVPDDSTPVLEVEYDGETQVVNLSSGTVDSGRAGPLSSLDGEVSSGQESWSMTERVRCGEEEPSGLDEIGFSCNSSPALELPYVRGLGWAEKGRPYVLVDVHQSWWPATGRKTDRAGLPVTLDGSKPAKTLSYGPGDVLVFRAGTNSHHRIRFHGVLDPNGASKSVDMRLDIETWRRH